MGLETRWAGPEKQVWGLGSLRAKRCWEPGVFNVLGAWGSAGASGVGTSCICVAGGWDFSSEGDAWAPGARIEDGREGQWPKV